jgi:hypothetical protein
MIYVLSLQSNQTTQIQESSKFRWSKQLNISTEHYDDEDSHS